MGIAERRVREKEALRTRIIEAARDIVSERGLDALSMRTLAERIEYSPATIYLYFKDKNELIGEVNRAGFEILGLHIEEELEKLGSPSNPMRQLRALGRGYVTFALANTAYFRVMFELPTVPNVGCPADFGIAFPTTTDPRLAETIIQCAVDEGFQLRGNPRKLWLIGWGVIHGLTSLYLSGHLTEDVSSHEAFWELVEEAMDWLGAGTAPRET